MSYIPRKCFNLSQQAIFLEFQIPGFRVIKKTHKIAVFEGVLKPFGMGKEYRVRISYKLKCRPKVTLPDEQFDIRPPHTFKDSSLCLYHRNGVGAWDSSQSLGKDLMPMISHWLWCYEMWLVTDKWYGDEYEHYGPKAG